MTALTGTSDADPKINLDGDAVFTVTKTADTNDGICDSDCSFREALALAQSGDTITFSPLFNAPQTISILTPLPSVAQSIAIQGPGANLLTLRREPNPQNLFRIFQIFSSATMSISGLTITNGDANFNEGGAIRNAGTLTITNCVITGNRAAVGGGIRNNGNLTVIGSTLSDNFATTAAGGLRNDSPGIAVFINSTISGNQTSGSGGGISSFAFNANASVQLTSSTVTNNTESGTNGGGIFTLAQGEGLTAATTLRNTIIANNSLPNLGTVGALAVVTSQGFNLTNDPTNIFLNKPTDQFNVNPLLAPLANNGGPTQTHAPLMGSPAIDRGSNAGSGVTTDQRGGGFLRVVDLLAPNASGGDGTDIGAFEVQTEPVPATIQGRVLRPTGQTLANARVTLTDPAGVRVVATTSSFGIFSFNNVATGQTYIITVASKRFRYAPVSLAVNGNVSGFDLVGLE